MSPEEFDNRLRSTFNDEYLPPKENMWQNINDRLETVQGSSTIWYWLAPLLIIVISGLAWLTFSNVSSNNVESAVVIENTTITTTDNQADVSAPGNSTAKNDVKVATSNNPEPNTGTNLNAQKNALTQAHSNSASNITKNNRTNLNQNPSLKQLPNFTDQNSGLNLNKLDAVDQNNSFTSNNTLDGQNNQTNSTESDLKVLEDDLRNSLKLSLMTKFKYLFNYDYNLDKRLSFGGYSNKKPNSLDKVYYAGNFEQNKDWINFGIGANKAYNSFVGYIDPTYTVHKDLWSVREKLTNNGAGFNTFLTYQRKFAFQNRLSYEIGVNFTSRTEDIKLNEYSRNIAYRDNDTIVQYQQFLFWTLIPGSDTNWRNLETPFVLLTKNRYSVFTLPFRINYEQPLSKHTFLSFGAGGGVSFINTRKSQHLDLVDETEFDVVKSKQIKSSINGMVSLYTNFNSLGQLGLYYSYQMHIGDYKLNDQYGIRMSDIQFGVTFRRPLNIK
ncbi:MAG: hypothetical protein IT245_06605 [Bacteroidia bacterium]|nr:hypothetical protein [Bacteroidia bacterium]